MNGIHIYNSNINIYVHLKKKKKKKKKGKKHRDRTCRELYICSWKVLKVFIVVMFATNYFTRSLK